MPMGKASAPAERIDNLFSLLKDQGDEDYIGESISQLEHCLQAAHLAASAHADANTIVAALLHDVGQFVPNMETQALLYGGENVGRCGHENLGADYLRALGFNEKVCSLVQAHVIAKRYLCATDPDYYASLSSASQKSLTLQGGPFSLQEVQEFEQDPIWKEKIQLRKWDDAAKVVGLKTPGIEVYRQMALGCVQTLV